MWHIGAQEIGLTQEIDDSGSPHSIQGWLARPPPTSPLHTEAGLLSVGLLHSASSWPPLSCLSAPRIALGQNFHAWEGSHSLPFSDLHSISEIIRPL